MNPFHFMDLPILLYSRIVAQAGSSLTATPLADTVSEFGQSKFDFTYTFIKMVFAMVVVIALALLLIRYVLPKLAFARVQGRGGDVQITDRIALDARKSVVILKVDGKRYLIGVSENYIGTLAQLQSKDENEA